MSLKKGFFFIFILHLSILTRAQYGFEWIRSDQQYYKFKIANTGVYKFDSATLVANGINLNGVDPKRFQIFKNGTEQYIYVHGQADGVFNNGDFIEFFAAKNDGSFDTQLYPSAAAQPHPWYSLYTDTAVYFLTILPVASVETGKRYTLSNDQSFGGYTAEPYFMNEVRVFPAVEYVLGTNLNTGGDLYVSSEYTDGEGWADSRLGLGDHREYTLNTPFLSAGPSPTLDVKIVGVSDYTITNPPNNHHVRISVAKAENLVYDTFRDFIFKGYISQKDSTAINASVIGTSQTVVKIEVLNDLAVASDFNQLSYIRLTYPRLYNFGGQASPLGFKVGHVQGGIKSKVTIVNYGSGAQTQPRLYDFKTNKRVVGVYDAGAVNMLIDISASPSEVFVFDSTQATLVTQLVRTDFKVINPAEGYEYIIVTHQKLNTAASAYEDYRSLRYKVLKVFSSELYDYYTYGNVHPLAVRRMAQHLLNTATVKPKFLALLGKGYQGNLMRQNQYYDQHLVPVLGVPASDVLFTTGINGDGGYGNDIATGRIPAFTNDELNNYLQKLKYYETNSDSIQLWRKNILHLSGGEDLNQQDAFKTQMVNLANVIKGKSFGGNVIAYHKNKSDATQGDLKNVLAGVVNNGVSMLTFLGHGSSTVIDVDFGSIDNIDNPNKYAFFYFNGCNIGNPSEIDPTLKVNLYGKDFVCAANKGAIGWLAHSNLTLDGKLYTQMNSFYNQLVVANYAQSVGSLLTIASKNISTGDMFMKSHCQQLTLLSDPALKIYSPVLPDYALQGNDLFMHPKDANAQLDSVAVGVILTNLGRATDDTIRVTLTRTEPNNVKKTYSVTSPRKLYYKDTLYIWMPVDEKIDVGNSTYEVTVDKENLLTEITRINNTAQFIHYLPGNGMQTLLPLTDQIVTKDSVMLVAQNNDLFVGNTEYLFEIDTTPSFNSPLLQTSGVITAGSIARWNVVLTAPDSTVYFWRSRMNIPDNQGGLWDTAAFTLIRGGAPGWAQSAFYQYSQVSQSDKLMFEDNKIDFVENFHEVISKQARWYHSGMGILDPYPLNPNVFACVNGGVIAMVYDARALEVKQANGYPMNCNPATNPTAFYYAFDTKTLAGQQDFARLVDSLEDGDYLAFYTSYDAGSATWGATMRNALAQIGSVKVAAMQNFYTCGVLIGKKGETPGLAYEDTVTTTSSSIDSAVILEVRRPLKGKWHTGSAISNRIGPARHWNSMASNFKSIENTGTDKTWLTLIGVTKTGTDSILINRTTNFNQSLAAVNASVFPYLKLKVEFEDSMNRTPNQFGRWLVNYDMTPEGCINPRLGYTFYAKQIQQGDSVKIDIAFENLTDVAFDSVPVEFTITDNNRIAKYTNSYTEPALAGNTYRMISRKMPTEGLSGNNIFSMAVNGKQILPEVTYVNNFTNIGFEVMVDKKNPMLDVTFDGYRIMNGDFVSPTPVIRLLSKDDNQFKIQKDTSTFNLFIKRPSDNGNFEKISFSSPEITFVSGTSTNNTAMLEYKPQRLDDGDYSLRVQAKDATGNAAGNNSYEIDFKVLNESTITNFFPYPNPGTTNIRFVFTLTGSRAPDQLLIRIMTITGKVVREITADEFGPIKIGNNISQFGWDGTDNFGDRLANGVYLYQVYSRIDGQTIKKRDLAADQFVLHNTGKIYLLK